MATDEDKKSSVAPQGSGNSSVRHPLLGSMKDVTWIAPGVDLTEPAMPEWADLIDEKYGKEPSA